MILDSSVLIAVVRNEPGTAEIYDVMTQAGSLSVSAATLLETSIVATRSNHATVDDILAAAGARIVPFDAEQARIARAAYATYGKGSGSPARLNFSDCVSYALATVTGEPLLFTGDDFTHTDITPAR